MHTSRTRRITLVSLFLVLSVCLAAEQPARTPLAMKNPVQDKNFYLLSAIEWTPAVHALVKADPALSQIGAAKRAAISEAVKSCGSDVPCYAKAALWTDEEIAKLSAALGALASNPPMRQLLDGPVARSGMYVRYKDRLPAEMLGKAWEDAAHKMNLGINVFALGQPGAHSFDTGSYDIKSDAFIRNVQFIALILDNDSKSLDLFFQPTMRFSLEVLRSQLRDEAGRHEPLEKGENKAAVARVPTIQWAKYLYTLIVVLGQGPDKDGVALAPGGRLRLIPAVEAYHEGKAPFILVSGGYVHPAFTHYSEAIEMKRALMDEFGVPESAIIVDPHARVTATNMRNAVRQIYRYGMPFEKKALVTSSKSHIDSVEKAQFQSRDNLGFPSYLPGARLSPFLLEFTPQIGALNTDLADLMDP